VGIGITDPSYTLEVSGNAYFTGIVSAFKFSTTSDYRIKSNITQLDNTYVVDKLNPVIYFNNCLGKPDIGLIAHELQEVYPELVIGEKDGTYLQSVNYLGLISILIKEIQEIKKEMQILKEQNK
jgi:hypothetical protein